MAFSTVKISALPAGGAIAAGNLMAIVQAGITNQINVTALLTYVAANLTGTVGISISGNAATATALTGTATVVTAATTFNVASAVPIPLYTVPAGKSFQALYVLIRGNTALVGAGADLSVGTTAGSNIDILSAVTLTSSLVAGQAMAPVPASAINTVVPAGGIINGFMSTVETSGAINVQLVGVLF